MPIKRLKPTRQSNRNRQIGMQVFFGCGESWENLRRQHGQMVRAPDL